MTFPATPTSCLFYCRSAPKIELNPSFRSAIREVRKPRLSLKSGDPLTFSDLEGDLTPSDFEFNFQPRFAKTYAARFFNKCEKSSDALRRSSMKSRNIEDFPARDSLRKKVLSGHGIFQQRIRLLCVFPDRIHPLSGQESCRMSSKVFVRPYF